MPMFKRPMMLALLALLALSQARAGDARPKVLLLTGSGPTLPHAQQYPPWVHEFQNEEVVRILEDSVRVDVVEDLSVLEDARLAPYEVVISNSLFLTPTPAQLDALRRHVTGGKALLTLHSGILSFLNADFYEEMIGGLFIGGPSTDPATFDVVTENMEFWYYGYAFRPARRHPISAALGDFEATDELYHFQPGDRDLQVIARAENRPVMWERRWGAGRVMSLVLGHDLRAKQNPGYRALLRNGVRWLAGYPIVQAVPDMRVDADAGRVAGAADLARLAADRDSGPLEFSLAGMEGDDVVDVHLDPQGRLDLSIKGREGVATVTLRVRGAHGPEATTDFQVAVHAQRRGNLARYHGVRASTSSMEARDDVKDSGHLVDGDPQTRWASASVDPSWAMVDLGRTLAFNTVALHWDEAFATRYEIQVSDDPERGWRTVFTEPNGDGAHDEVHFPTVEARYVRMLGHRRKVPQWGYSLYELAVYNR
jgi:type 1 glutamine amidotransferase